jgi:MFS family permease
LQGNERSKGSIMRGLGRNVILLGIVSLLADISSEMVNPLIPIFLTSVLLASPEIVGLVSGAADSTSNLVKVVVGWYSDRIHRRKPFVAIGYAPTAIVKPLMAIITTWPQMLAIRILDRGGKGVRTAPRDALLVDSVPVEKRGAAFGLHRGLDSAGAIIGTAISILLLLFLASNTNDETIRLIFILSSIPAFISVFVVVFFVKEKEQKESSAGETKKFWATLKGADPRLKRYLAIVAMIGFANVGYTFLVLRAYEFGAGLTEVLLIYLAMNITYTLFSFPAGIISDKVGKKKMIAVGLLIFIAGALTMALASSLIMLLAGFLIYGTFLAVIDVNESAYASMLSKKSDRGTVMGAYHTVNGIVALPAGFLFGLVWSTFGDSGPLAAFGYVSIVAVVSLVLLMVFITEPKSTAEPS